MMDELTLSPEKANAVVSAIKSTGGSALAVVGDVLDDAYIKTLVQKAAEFGGGKIHILVNNAGYTWDGVIHKMTDKQWHTIVDLHATAPFKIIREAAPYFRVKDGEPRNVIMISSTSGLNGNAGQINYALAKAGVTGVTKTIAKEYVYPSPTYLPTYLPREVPH
jgi:3-oxoacyl-[acyl-carrier protein] reductase